MSAVGTCEISGNVRVVVPVGGKAEVASLTGLQRRKMTQCMVRPCVARGFVELAVSGLASMYPAFDWSVMLRATMDISARAISLADRPQRAIWVTSVRMRREDRSSISSHPLADLGR